MKYLFTLILLVVSTLAISQNRYSYFINDAAYNRFPGINIQVIQIKSQKIIQEQISDSMGIVKFTRFNRKTHQLRAIIKDNLHLDSTLHSAYQYGFQINATKTYYDSIRNEEIEKFEKSIAHYTKEWNKIDAYYDSLSLFERRIIDTSRILKPKSKIGIQKPRIGPHNKINTPFLQNISYIRDFLKVNLKYPELSQAVGDEGTVYVDFKIQIDGKLTHAKVVRSVSKELDFEALRLIRLLPNQKPCSLNGVHVPCNFAIPIIFILG